MTIQELEKKAKNANIYQYHKAAKALKEKGYVIFKNLDYSARIYVVDDNEIECIATNITRHRAKQVVKAIKENQWGSIPFEIQQNYLTNGYTTRKGLFANYDKQIKHIGIIAYSHLLCDDVGIDGHFKRQIIRKTFFKGV